MRQRRLCQQPFPLLHDGKASTALPKIICEHKVDRPLKVEVSEQNFAIISFYTVPLVFFRTGLEQQWKLKHVNKSIVVSTAPSHINSSYQSKRQFAHHHAKNLALMLTKMTTLNVIFNILTFLNVLSLASIKIVFFYLLLYHVKSKASCWHTYMRFICTIHYSYGGVCVFSVCSLIM